MLKCSNTITRLNSVDILTKGSAGNILGTILTFLFRVEKGGQ
jgi:hypothetical protein